MSLADDINWASLVPEPPWSFLDDAGRQSLAQGSALERARSYYHLADNLFASSANDDAAAYCYVAAHELHPKAAAYVNMGIVLRRTGRQHAALRAFERAVYFTPDKPEAHHNLRLMRPSSIDGSCDSEHSAPAPPIPPATPVSPPPLPLFNIHPERFSAPTAADTAGRIYLLPGFLSDDEVRYFRAMGDAHPERFNAAEWGSYASVNLPQSSDPEATLTIRTVETRIAALTGLAVSPHDSPLQLSVSRPWDPSRGLVFNMHHDSNRKPRRVATVLMYLSDAESDELEGGETLFPCSTPADAVAGDTVGENELCARLVSGYARGERFLSIPNGYHPRIPCFDSEAAVLASAYCHAGLVGTDDPTPQAAPLHPPTTFTGGQRGLRILPKRGWAALFLSASPYADGAPAFPDMWHGGCRVQRGEKWTLQQFKELQ
jgi:hypothetical protein